MINRGIGLCLVAPVLDAPQIVAHWPLHEGANTEVYDVMGNNNGTIAGLDPAVACIDDGATGGAVRFDVEPEQHIELLLPEISQLWFEGRSWLRRFFIVDHDNGIFINPSSNQHFCTIHNVYKDIRIKYRLVIVTKTAAIITIKKYGLH